MFRGRALPHQPSELHKASTDRVNVIVSGCRLMRSHESSQSSDPRWLRLLHECIYFLQPCYTNNSKLFDLNSAMICEERRRPRLLLRITGCWCSSLLKSFLPPLRDVVSNSHCPNLLVLHSHHFSSDAVFPMMQLCTP